MIVSLIIPVYNVEINYFKECIDSIVMQTFSELQIIIVNDGSNQYLSELYENYIDNYCKSLEIEYIYTTNYGVSHARNEGLAHARGEYVVFVDADDLISPNYIEGLVKFAEINSLDMAVGCLTKFKTEKDVNDSFKDDFYLIDDKQDIIKSILTRGMRRFDVSGLVGCCCKLIERNLAESILFDTDIPIGEDLVYSINLFEQCKKAGIYYGVNYFYRIGINSAMTRYRENAFEINAKLIDKLISMNNRGTLQIEDIAARALYQYVIAGKQALYNAEIKKSIFIKKKIMKYQYDLYWKNVIVNANIKDLNFKNRIVYFLLRTRLFGLLGLIMQGGK